jgi:hypothetical protein
MRTTQALPLQRKRSIEVVLQHGQLGETERRISCAPGIPLLPLPRKSLSSGAAASA